MSPDVIPPMIPPEPIQPLVLTPEEKGPRPHVWESTMVRRQHTIHYRCKRCGRGPFTAWMIQNSVSKMCEGRPRFRDGVLVGIP